MTTVAQMIEWLKTLPQDAEVECGVESTRAYENFYETYMSMAPVDIKSCEVFDYIGPVYEKYPDLRGKTIVHICGE